MTCRMAAGQQKKQLRSSTLHEQYRGKKKKKLESSDYILNIRSHIDLEWDDSQKRAVAKKEQIGISWKDMSPFIDSVSQSRSGVADVILVPHEIFSLNDLTEVLSYEVWATCLSESERKLLTQFLPSGTGAEQVVHSLLKGENHHFGNPYLQWSTSLCMGKLHPDTVFHVERQFRGNKRAYYHEISKYHTGMLEVLKKWKEKWLSCNNSEELWSEGLLKNKQGSPASADQAKVPNITKKETPQKISIQNGDDKYMSYIKISRAQHQLVKNIKHSGDGIQSKFLSRVIGDIKNFHVYPYETFEEEEKKQLHVHWLQVVKKDIPAAFELARNKKLQIEQWGKSLEEELIEKRNLIMDKVSKSENLGSSPQEPAYSGAYRNPHMIDIEDESASDTDQDSADNYQLEHVHSLNGHQQPIPMDFNQGAAREDTLKSADDLSPLSHSLSNQSSKQSILEPDVPLSSGKGMWQTATNRDSYYHTSSEGNEYTSAGELSLRQPQLSECANHVIDLERDMIETKAGESIPSAFDIIGGASLVCSFGNQDRSEMLRTFTKGSPMLSSYQPGYINGMKQPGLQLPLMGNASLPESSQFPNHFEEQQQLLEQGEARQKELYLHQMINKNMFSSGRYQSQGQFPTIEQQNFSALQSSVNGGSPGYNWFNADNQPSNSWYGVESSSSSRLGSGGSADGSLYSVLSNKLSACTPYDTTNSEQYAQARNFFGGFVPNSQNIYGYAQNQLDNSSVHDLAAAPSMNNGSWMNFPNQNPTLHDPQGRSFLRPWNR